jgi:hypothetical protein
MNKKTQRGLGTQKPKKELSETETVTPLDLNIICPIHHVRTAYDHRFSTHPQMSACTPNRCVSDTFCRSYGCNLPLSRSPSCTLDTALRCSPPPIPGTNHRHRALRRRLGLRELRNGSECRFGIGTLGTA